MACNECECASDNSCAKATVGRSRLKPIDTSVERAWLQCLKLTYDKLLSDFAFNLNLRRYHLDFAVQGCQDCLAWDSTVRWCMLNR
jgi:hypothetical protein